METAPTQDPSTLAQVVRRHRRVRSSRPRHEDRLFFVFPTKSWLSSCPCKPHLFPCLIWLHLAGGYAGQSCGEGGRAGVCRRACADLPHGVGDGVCGGARSSSRPLTWPQRWRLTGRARRQQGRGGKAGRGKGGAANERELAGAQGRTAAKRRDEAHGRAAVERLPQRWREPEADAGPAIIDFGRM